MDWCRKTTRLAHTVALCLKMKSTMTFQPRHEAVAPPVHPGAVGRRGPPEVVHLAHRRAVLELALQVQNPAVAPPVHPEAVGRRVPPEVVPVEAPPVPQGVVLGVGLQAQHPAAAPPVRSLVAPVVALQVRNKAVLPARKPEAQAVDLPARSRVAQVAALPAPRRAALAVAHRRVPSAAPPVLEQGAIWC